MAVIVRGVNPARLLLPVAALLLAAGCAGVTSTGRTAKPQNYYEVVATDYRGALTARWIAEGRVRRTPAAFRFRAVERLSSPPFPVQTRYPLGRNVQIAGINITVTPCGKPLWLYELDGF